MLEISRSSVRAFSKRSEEIRPLSTIGVVDKRKERRTWAEQQKNVQEQDVNQLRKVRREKLAELQANGKDPFTITKYDVTCHAADIKDHYEEMEGKQVSVAGRMMHKRVMGKASFCNVQDQSGNIQSYVARDSVGEEAYKEFKKLDIGDIVGIEGEVFKTKTGEISIHASAVTLLSKSLQILPEKFHGLTNTDTRYRQRYVDLIMNPEVQEIPLSSVPRLSAPSADIWTARDSWRWRRRCW